MHSFPGRLNAAAIAATEYFPVVISFYPLLWSDFRRGWGDEISSMMYRAVINLFPVHLIRTGVERTGPSNFAGLRNY